MCVYEYDVEKIYYMFISLITFLILEQQQKYKTHRIYHNSPNELYKYVMF